MARNQVCSTTITRTLTGVATGLLKFRCPVAGQIVRVKVWVGSAPAGGTALFDVNINGTSIWDADQSQRITIPDAGTNHARTGLTSAVVVDDEISVDFDGFTGTASGVGTFFQVVIDIEEDGASATDAELSGGGLSGVQMPIAAVQGNNYNTVEWDTPTRDDGSYYDGGIFSPVIPSDSWYVISIGLVAHSVQVGKWTVAVTANGIEIMTVLVYPLAADDTFTINITRSVYLETGDQVLVSIVQAGTPDINVDVASGTFFTITPA
jgi:hypothetical protein